MFENAHDWELLLEFDKRRGWEGVINVLHWTESSRRKKCPTTHASASPIEKHWRAFSSLSFLKERMHEGRGEEKVHILWVEM